MRVNFYSNYLFYLALLLVPNTLLAANHNLYDKELRESQIEITTLDNSIRLDEKKRKTIQQRLRDRNKRIKRLNSKINTLEERIQTSAKKLKLIEANLVIQRRNTHQKKSLLAKQIRLAYQLGRQTDVQVLLNQNNPESYGRLSVYADYFSRARQKEITTALQSVRILTETRLKAAQVRKTHTSDRQKLAHIQKSEESEQRIRKRLLTQLESGITNKKSQISQLKISIAKLQSLVEQIDNNNKNTDLLFDASRGKLPWPLDGLVKAHYGQNKTGGKLRWNGMFITALVGSDVHTIADGEVVYADWLNGFGLLLIISHNDGLMSLYGNNRDLMADTGEIVKMGQLIATVGNSSGQKESGLYFEVRENAVAVDPEKWIVPQIQYAKSGLIQAQ